MTGAAFFDLDKTVVARPSGLAFSRHFFNAGLITRGTWYQGLVAQSIYLMRGADEARMEQWRLRGLDLSRGQERAGFGKVIEGYMAEVIRPIILQEALALMEWHRSEGRCVFLVSSSPEEVVCPIGALLGVDGVVATRSRVDDTGRYLGELEFYCYGPHKATAMQALAAERDLDMAESWAYSDSITDLPMLEAVGHAVAANPDRELRHVARQRGWHVVRFRRPVALSPLRVAMATSRRRAALAVTVAAGVLAALDLRRRGRPRRTALLSQRPTRRK